MCISVVLYQCVRVKYEDLIKAIHFVRLFGHAVNRPTGEYPLIRHGDTPSVRFTPGENFHVTTLTFCFHHLLEQKQNAFAPFHHTVYEVSGCYDGLDQVQSPDR